MQANFTPKSLANDESYTRMQPGKLNLWIFMVASSMLFAAILSAFLVAQPDGMANNNWVHVPMPLYFLYSLITVMTSSVTLFLAQKAASNDELGRNRIFLYTTFVLGLLFCYFQFRGWQDLVSAGFYFRNDSAGKISGSYTYVITALHLLHVLGGIILLLVGIIRSHLLLIHKKSMKFMQMTSIYWHFVGVLWIILYLFLYFAG